MSKDLPRTHRLHALDRLLAVACWLSEAAQAIPLAAVSATVATRNIRA